jgi:hypothetical protein
MADKTSWLRRAVGFLTDPRTLALGYFGFAFIAVLLMDLIVPPLAAPDEFAHLLHAESLSSGQFVPAPGTDRLVGGLVDASMLDLFKIMEPVAGIATPTQMEAASKARRLAWTGNPIFFAFPNTGQNGPGLYLPQAAGLAIGRGAGLSIIGSYDLARFFGSLAAIGIAAIAIANAGRAALPLAILLSTPMFLFLAASVAQDGMLVAVSALFAVLVAKPRAPDARATIWLAWFCALLMVMARPPYAPLAFLLIRGRGGRSFGQWLRAPDGPLAPLLLGMIALAWLVAVGVLSEPGFAPDPSIDARAQMAALLQHPGFILQIAAGTLTYVEYIRVSQEVIGVLGSLSIVLSQDDYATGRLAIELAAATCLLQFSGRSPLFRPAAAVMLLLAFGAVYVALYVTWTPVGADVMTSVQGRYLLPLLAIVPLVIPSLIPMRWRAGRYPTLALDLTAAAIGFTGWGLMISISADALLLLRLTYGSVFSGPWHLAIP